MTKIRHHLKRILQVADESPAFTIFSPQELTEDLHFDMSGLLNELFHKKRAVAERCQGF